MNSNEWNNPEEKETLYQPDWIKKSRCTSFKDSAEVIHQHEVSCVGDLHGNFRTWATLLDKLNLVQFSVPLVYVNEENLDEEFLYEWVGGDRKLVQLGDVLGDRHKTSIRTVLSFSELRKQARLEGGDLITIHGNHDHYLIRWLLGVEVGFLRQYYHSNQSVGLDEFMNKWGSTEQLAAINDLDVEYMSQISRKISPEAKAQLFSENRDKKMALISEMGKQIAQVLKTDPVGRQVLKEICHGKLIEQVEDEIFVHAPLTQGAVEVLQTAGNNLQESIDQVNAVYQRNLRNCLLGNDQVELEYQYLSYLFLNTNAGERAYAEDFDEKTNQLVTVIDDQNLVFLNEDQEKWLIQSGVNRLVHGHELASPSRYRHLQVYSVENNVGKHQYYFDDDGRGFLTFPKGKNKVKDK